MLEEPDPEPEEPPFAALVPPELGELPEEGLAADPPEEPFAAVLALADEVVDVELVEVLAGADADPAGTVNGGAAEVLATDELPPQPLSTRHAAPSASRAAAFAEPRW